MNRSLLVIDDDQRLGQLLQEFLGREGYRVLTANSAEMALEIDVKVDGLVLDVMMPGMTGIELTKMVRDNKTVFAPQIPIILLTARSEVDDRIVGLQAGASDYLPKPFDPRELLLRIANILPAQIMADLVYGGVTISPNTGEVMRDGVRLELSEREHSMMAKLAQAQGEPVSRDILGEVSWEAALNSRAVDVQINRLRRQVEIDPANPRIILTRRNRGYCLAKPDPVS
ncbi:MAG TPA: DNA-binding response regulator [Alphaproteobacteria bacterium]|nr:DNA-binding response regulator [Alphaproteobacteria bacterium]